MASGNDAIADILLQLSQDVSDFEAGKSVRVLQGAPSSDEFLRTFVSKNRPCLCRGAVAWPALADWSLGSLCQKIGDHVVTCSTTPDGRADSVVQNVDQGLCFAQPHTQQLPFSAFKALLDDTTASGVPSIQFQNSNLTEELPELVGDVEASIGWASTAFGCEPDAVNIWVGDKRCSTSFHKDHYENMYTVISGTKTFTLLPGTSIHRLHLGSYTACTQKPLPDGTWALEPEDPARQVQWCPVDVDAIDASGALEDAQRQNFPRYFEGPPPLRVTVHAGETLYLPSMWYHYVQQDEGDADAVIAVNHWYDMKFDGRFAFFQCVERLAEHAGLIQPAPRLPE